MTQQDNTEAAPTAAAEPATTAIPPATHAAPELAWSQSDDDSEEPAHHSRLVWSGLVVLIVVIAGALILFGTTLFGAGSPKPVERSAKPAPGPRSPVAAAPPVTVTAAPSPPAVPPAPPCTAAQDQQLLGRLAIHYTMTNPDWTLDNAHRYCVLVAQGIPEAKAQKIAASDALTGHPVGNDVGIESLSPSNGTASDDVDAAWDSITTEAMVVYPGCR